MDELPLDPLTLYIVPDEDGSAAYTMIDEDEAVVVSSLLQDGMLDLQVRTQPCGLVLNVNTSETIERVVCNGEELELRQLDVNLYSAEMKGRDDS